jgi:hypothetical protein
MILPPLNNRIPLLRGDSLPQKLTQIVYNVSHIRHSGARLIILKRSTRRYHFKGSLETKGGTLLAAPLGLHHKQNASRSLQTGWHLFSQF